MVKLKKISFLWTLTQEEESFFVTQQTMPKFCVRKLAL